MNLKSFLLAGLDWSTFSQFTMLPSWSILSLFWRSRTHVTLSLLGSLDSQSISCLCLCNFKEGGTYYYIFRHEVILTQKKWRYKRILDAKLLKLRESGVQDSIRRSWEDDLPRCKVLNDDDDSIALGPGLNIWSTFNANIHFCSHGIYRKAHIHVHPSGSWLYCICLNIWFWNGQKAEIPW